MRNGPLRYAQWPPRWAPLPTRRSIKTVQVRQGVTASYIEHSSAALVPTSFARPRIERRGMRARTPLLGCSREQSAADLQCQSHLRIDVSCIGAQRRERHAEETNSFVHRKLRGEELLAD